MGKGYVGSKHACIGMQAGHLIIIPIQHGGQQTRQKQPVCKIKMSHDAKIDWDKSAIRGNEDVAGMHIGMKEAVAEYLIEETPRCCFGDFFNVVACRC